MRQNSERRAALLDAAIEVLAREGARGLTLRAVDSEAGVPQGTASNYFRDRAQLLAQLMRRTRERLAPDPDLLAKTLRAAPSGDLVATLMRQLLARMRADRSSHLAMLELRLEATRRPDLHTELAGFLTAELAGNIGFHLDTGLPGDETGARLLYLAMSGLLVDELTLPELHTDQDLDTLVDALVDRVL